jgi:beta-glucosidase
MRISTRVSRDIRPFRAFGVGAVVLALLAAGQAAAPAADIVPRQNPACPWSDPHLSPDRRAHLLLQASTLGQKLRWLDEQSANAPAQTTFGTVTYPVQVACTPVVKYTDGPDYERGIGGATVFPAQIALAASWDQDLAYAKGATQADEAFRGGSNAILGPGVSSSRSSLAGRTPEYLGEDSLLSGTMAAAGINGIQDGNRDEPVMAVVKHYLANEQELDRQLSSSNLSERTLREVYDLPFQILLSRSEPGGVMCSYNQLNGVFACENPVLKTLLKRDLGFQGYVVSDFGAVHSTAPSISAGLDQELNRPRFYTPATIGAAIDAGQISEADVDAAALRVVRAYLAAGLFDHPLPATPSTSVGTAEHADLARREAEQGSVLLKNTGGVLPLSPSARSIAVIGPTASSTPTNGISARSVCAEGSAASSASPCPAPVAPLDAIRARAARNGTTVSYADGSDLAVASATAAAADVTVVFGYAKQGEFADRSTLALDGDGDALISAVTAANPHTVVVLETGSATTMPWLASAPAVVEAWYPGQEQGTALARLLYGDVDFTGRLPMTFPKSIADTPTAGSAAQYPGVFADGSTARPAGDTTSIRQVSYSEGRAVGYKWYDSHDVAPLFAFGAGLSYTRFAYPGPVAITAARHGRRKISFTVANTGNRSGTETSQVYLTLPPAAGEPGKRLVGYARTTVRPGASARMSLWLDPASGDRPLSVYHPAAGRWRITPGTYTVQVGSSSRNLSPGRRFEVR